MLLCCSLHLSTFWFMKHFLSDSLFSSVYYIYIYIYIIYMVSAIIYIYIYIYIIYIISGVSYYIYIYIITGVSYYIYIYIIYGVSSLYIIYMVSALFWMWLFCVHNYAWPVLSMMSSQASKRMAVPTTECTLPINFPNKNVRLIINWWRMQLYAAFKSTEWQFWAEIADIGLLIF